MKISRIQLERICRKILAELKASDIITYKSPEDQVLKCAVGALEADLEKEQAIEREARKMVEDLERKGSGEFDRHKMYLMIKKKLASDRKVIL